MKTIVTFYSYKGGVGRTMAMSNVAVLLARRGLKVLAVDWDLEAPGLERYFGYFTLQASKGGLLPLLKSQQHGSRGHYRSHLTHVSGAIDGATFALDLLPSGRETDTSYSSTLERFDWDAYFADGGGDFIEGLRQQWRRDYDVTLIDSRTGLSDTGGICTIQLPDVVVAMFTANYQSLYGVRDTMRLAQAARDTLAYERMHLRVLPVPARFGRDAEAPEAKEWTARIADVLGEFYGDWLPSWATPHQVAGRLRIPQVDAFGFGEKLAAVEESGVAGGPMTPIYGQLAELLIGDPPDAAAVLRLDEPTRKPAPSPTPAPAREAAETYDHDIFVSHAAGTVLDEWVDGFLKRLGEQLYVVLGHEPRIFLDLSQVHVDEVWRASVARHLQRSRLLLAMVTPKFVSSDWCRLEWATFERREALAGGASPLIVPLLLREPETMPEWIVKRQWFDLRDMPQHVTALSDNAPAVHATVARIADEIARALRKTPRFDPAWPVATPDDLRTSPLPPVEPAPSERALDADAITALLEQNSTRAALDAGRKLMTELLRTGDFANLIKVAKAVHDKAPADDETTIRLARGLLETGQPADAEALLEKVLPRLPRSSPERAEVSALLGRAYTERFVSQASKTTRVARSALSRAIKACDRAYRADRARYLEQGIRLAALLTAARRLKIPTPQALRPKTLARSVLKRLEKIPESLRHRLYHAQVAELQLVLDDWLAVDKHLEAFLATPDLTAGELRDVYRELTEIWNLEADEVRGAPLIAVLRARLLSTAGGSVNLGAATARAAAAAPAISSAALERLADGAHFKSVRWMQTAYERVSSIGEVRDQLGRTHGTCFIVAGPDIGLPSRSWVAITAAHVVGPRGLSPSQVVLAFGGAEPPLTLQTDRVVWMSPPEALDTAVLGLDPRVQTLTGLPLATSLPTLDVPQRVYLIGHAGGSGLSFSMDDNELLDHDGARLHYRAATTAGSSGSPVFNERWDVIGVHHRGGQLSRLREAPGTYQANEGISILAIVEAIRKK